MMCSICGCCRCPAGCPNAEESKTVFDCKICGKSIVVGDEYIEFENSRYHRECFEGLSTGELIETIGGIMGEASEGDIYDGSDEAYECMRDEKLLGI